MAGFKKSQSPELPAAYLVKFDGAPDMMGMIKAVEFVHGHGVLDKISVGSARADFVDAKTGELKDPAFLDTLAKFWANRGAKVEAVAQDKADAYRIQLSGNPKGHLPKTKPEPKTPTPRAPTVEAPNTVSKRPVFRRPPHKK